MPKPYFDTLTMIYALIIAVYGVTLWALADKDSNMISLSYLSRDLPNMDTFESAYKDIGVASAATTTASRTNLSLTTEARLIEYCVFPDVALKYPTREQYINAKESALLDAAWKQIDFDAWSRKTPVDMAKSQASPQYMLPWCKCVANVLTHLAVVGHLRGSVVERLAQVTDRFPRGRELVDVGRKRGHRQGQRIGEGIPAAQALFHARKRFGQNGMAGLIFERPDSLDQGNAGFEQQGQLLQGEDPVLHRRSALSVEQARFGALRLHCRGGNADDRQPLTFQRPLRVTLVVGVQASRENAAAAVNGFILK